MGKQKLLQLHNSLLQGGVAYKHVRRFITELKDHHSDLENEAISNGSNADDAKGQAASKLGDPELLVQEMLQRPELKSYGSRYPLILLGLMPVLSYILLSILWVLLMIGLILFFHSSVLEEGVIARPSDMLIAVINTIRFSYLYLFPFILIFVIVSYAIKNSIAFKYYGLGLLFLSLTSASVYLNLVWPDPVNAIEGSINVSFGVLRWVFPPDFFIRLSAYVLFAFGLKQFITQKMQSEIET